MGLYGWSAAALSVKVQDEMHAAYSKPVAIAPRSWCSFIDYEGYMVSCMAPCSVSCVQYRTALAYRGHPV